MWVGVMAETIRVGIMGYGNLGKGVEASLSQMPDMQLAAVFTDARHTLSRFRLKRPEYFMWMMPKSMRNRLTSWFSAVVLPPIYPNKHRFMLPCLTLWIAMTRTPKYLITTEKWTRWHEPTVRRAPSALVGIPGCFR